MKKGVIVVLVLLVFSVSFVGAEFNETGAGNETEIENVTEPEICPTVIGWRVEGRVCVSESGCDYDFLEYGYYRSEEECIAELSEPEEPKEEQCEDGEIKYYECSDGTRVPECGCESGMWVCKISVEDDCPDVESPETCAVKIDVSFDKTSYVVGDSFEIRIGVFDSQENPLPNYPFYAKMYDDRWHTPGLERTGSDGYFKHDGVAEKLPRGITDVKFNVYTKEIGSCGVVEDTTHIEVRQALVPCGFGDCVPELECSNKIKMCGGDCPPCSDEDEGGEIFYSCRGCDVDDKCYPMGYRKGATYCSEDYEFVSQVEDDASCENNFECETNVCIDGECIDSGLWKKIIRWIKRFFGGGDEPELEVDCSELLIERDIGDYVYNQSIYGHKDMQVPVYSEDGTQLDIVKCCAAQYLQGEKNIMGLVCPFDSREDMRNSLRWLVVKEGNLGLGEYRGEKLIMGSQNSLVIWMSDTYIVVSGGDPNSGGELVGQIADAYFEEYPNDFDLTEDDIPYIVPEKSIVFCSEEDKKAVKKCIKGGGNMQSNPSSLDGTEEGKKSCIDSKGFGEGCCEVYAGCESSDGGTEYRDGAKEFLMKAELVGELTLIDFETTADGTVLQNGDRLTGREWRSLGVVFEFPGEDYLQVFGSMEPFNPLGKLSLSPGLGPFEAGGDTHDDLNIIFSEPPVKAAGIYLLDLGDTDERESITFFDIDGNVIERISPWPESTFGNPAPGTFVSLVYDGIARIEILENTQDGDDIAYDNLYFVR